MSSIGTGYDLSASQFSPDGRIFQVEFAQKAVANSGTAIGLRGKNGVVFAVKKPVTSKLYEAGANKRIFTIDRHVGVAVAGLISDARQVVETARSEAATYRSDYNDAIPLKYLKDRVAMHMHAYTLYSSLRPYGASVILGAYEYDGPQMYCIDPSGTAWGYYGCAIGKAKQEAKKQMEFLQLKDLTIDQLVKEAAKIIYNVQNEINDRNFELELSWVGEITNGKHVFVPKNVFEEAEKYAVESDDSDEEDLDSSWSSH